jgi:UDP-2-acetamido-3-amino-2,3-dideoxy-glucuronate N-acetyltransferase
VTAKRQSNLAVIGCGYWGKNLIRNFDALEVLALVCDATPAGRALAA